MNRKKPPSPRTHPGTSTPLGHAPGQDARPIGAHDPSSMPRAEDDDEVFARSPEFNDQPGSGKHRGGPSMRDERAAARAIAAGTALAQHAAAGRPESAGGRRGVIMARARKAAPALLVHDVMTPEPVSLSVSATVQQAAARMRDEGVGAIIVTDGEAMCGLVTDRDIAVRCVANGHDGAQTSLREICSQADLATVSPDDEIARAIELMRARSVRRLPVLDHDRPVGILSLGDLALNRDPHSVLAEISAALPNR